MTWFNYNFYPVGQGLFSSGHLATEPGRRFAFNWVYDCGTRSSQNLITESIEVLDAHLAHASTPSRIELMALSHFDADHISGVVELMRHRKVHTLLLPYVPLHQRLELAFDQDLDINGDTFGFFLNPAQFIIANAEEFPPERIVFVPPAGPDDRVGVPEGGPESGDNDPYQPLLESRSPSGDDESVLGSAGSNRTRVEFLAERSSIRVKRFWEFVPYNDARFTPSDPAFITEVEQLRDALLIAANEAERSDALRDLKRKYRSIYPVGPKANQISLFLYGGALPVSAGARILDNKHYPNFPRRIWVEHWHGGPWPYPISGWGGDERSGVLYTGDGFLNNATRLKALCDYLGTPRIRNVGCFQVMHHGSKYNWFPGVTDVIRPWLSVIPADPRPGGHPHPEVVQAFWPFGAVSVDRRRGAWVAGLVDH